MCITLLVLGIKEKLLSEKLQKAIAIAKEHYAEHKRYNLWFITGGSPLRSRLFSVKRIIRYLDEKIEDIPFSISSTRRYPVLCKM